MYVAKSGFTPVYLELLHGAIRVTRPEFIESNIFGYLLTQYEITIINQIAGYYTETGNPEQAKHIYSQLLAQITEQFVDETEKAKAYSTIIYNYSRCLGRMGMRYEAIEIINDGIKFDRERDRMTMLPNLMFNYAFNLLSLGHKKESLAYFALAYYGCLIFAEYGKAGFLSVINNVTQENFNFTFPSK